MPMGLPLALMRPARDGCDGDGGAEGSGIPGPAYAPAPAAGNLRNWIAVASAEHARRGRDHRPLGFMQLCHGKPTPLRRIRAGDRIACYAPTLAFGGKDRLRSFVSIGVVQGGDPHAVDMGNGFVPWRRDVRYLQADDAPIAPLIPALNFIDDATHWGAKFRFGLVAVDDEDMRRIAAAMHADAAALGL